MEKRSFKRISSKIDARFFSGNLFYSGTVLNLSEKGMFISANMCFSSESRFLIMIHEENKLLNFVARVKHARKTNGYHKGMGIELLKSSGRYTDFVNRFGSL